MKVSIFWVGLVIVPHSVAASQFYLVILHQSDYHSMFHMVDIYGGRCRNASYQIERKLACHFGGFPRASQYVKDVKKDPYTPNVLVLNSGDFFTGDTMHIAFKGELASSMAKHMPYDAVTIGNKDFSEGIDELVIFMQALGPIFVCTNLDFDSLNTTVKNKLQTLCPRHRIVTLSGRQIAIFGYLAPDAVSVAKTTDIHIKDEVEALTREVAVAQGKGVKILIALGHSGYERDKEIAAQVPGLDMIVGGHSHSLLWPDLFSEEAVGEPADPEDSAVGPYPTVVRTDGRVVLILHAYWAGKYVGNINVTFDDAGEVQDWWAQPELMRPGMPEDEDARRTLAEFDRRMDEWMHTPIGFSLVQLVGLPEYCYNSECSMGNLLTDAVLWALRVDAGDAPVALPTLALMNSGAIQNSLPIGNITIKDMDAALPWRNYFDVITISGGVLKETLEYGVSKKDMHGKLIQVSGAKVVYHMSGEVGNRVESVEVLCHECAVPRYEALDESRKYVVASSKYIIDGGDGFTMLTRHEARQRFELLDLSVLESYLRQMSPVYPIIEDRVVVEHDGHDDERGAAGRSGARAAAVWLALLLMVIV